MFCWKSCKSQWTTAHFCLDPPREWENHHRSDCRDSQALLHSPRWSCWEWTKINIPLLIPLLCLHFPPLIVVHTHQKTHRNQSIGADDAFVSLQKSPDCSTTTEKRDSKEFHNRIIIFFLNKIIWSYINRTIITCNLFKEAIRGFIFLTFDLHMILHLVCFETELFKALLTSFYINENIIWN